MKLKTKYKKYQRSQPVFLQNLMQSYVSYKFLIFYNIVYFASTVLNFNEKLIAHFCL